MCVGWLYIQFNRSRSIHNIYLGMVSANMTYGIFTNIALRTRHGMPDKYLVADHITDDTYLCNNTI